MTIRNIDPLFQPLKVKSLQLENRIVMAPMTRGQCPQGTPNADVAAYYRRRAENGVGLILSESTAVDRPAARHEAGIPFFHGEAALRGWGAVIDGVHAAGGKMGPQLWHVGTFPSATGEWAPNCPPESPSGLLAADQPVGKVMSEEDVVDTIAAFGRAARDAKSLGFDVVELHGAHGYLIDQFFWDATNRRTDRFGGETLPERNRFAIEMIRAVRAAIGPDMPIIFRISQWKQQDYTVQMAHTPDALSDWLGPLVDAGVDILHCSQRRFWQPEFPHLDGDDGLNLAGWVKKLTGATTISVGSVGLSGDPVASFSGESSLPTSLENLMARMGRGEFDLIAVGRALLSDPAWAAKVRSGDMAALRGFDPAAFGEYI